MRTRQLFALVLMSSILAGCGTGNAEVPTDPSQLKPLTEAEKAEIKKQDDAVQAEEGEGQKIRFDNKKK